MEKYLLSARNLFKWFLAIVQYITILTLIYILYILNNLYQFWKLK